MRFWVVDTETTGVDHGVDKIVEVAGVLLEDGVRLRTYQSLVNPGRDVPPQASAIHHITDKHLVEAPSLDEAVAPMLEDEVDFYVAHNARFDMGFLKPFQGPWLCTYKLALRVWPDAPSHSNQVLRYWLEVDDPESDSHAHRALYDAEVTANIFCRMLERSTSADPYPKMLEISSEPALLRKVGFGEHHDKLWSEVPVSYLQWMVRKSSGWDEDKIYTARYWLDKHTRPRD